MKIHATQFDTAAADVVNNGEYETCVAIQIHF